MIEQVKAFEHGFDISQDKILGDSCFDDVNKLTLFDEYTLSICPTAVLNTWEKIPEPGKTTEPYSKVIQGLREPFYEDSANID